MGEIPPGVPPALIARTHWVKSLEIRGPPAVPNWQCPSSTEVRVSERTESKEYRAWANMLTRCYNPKYVNFHRYGGRGVRVCERWRLSFDAFLADVGPATSPQHTLDRFPDRSGHYEPGNVRWATKQE